MDVSGWVWAATLLGLGGVLTADLIIIGRRPHAPSLRESVYWSVLYVGLAAAFGLVVWLGYGATYAGEYYAGWLVEKSLSVDNLFVFMLIMSRFAVPRAYQSRVLLIGIVLALVMRGAFIATGAVLTSHFRWIFYLFGAFLIFTAVKVARDGHQEPDEFKENPLIRWTRRLLPVSPQYDRGRMLTSVDGRRMVTPMLIVMITIGTTDLIFALDSIPAIFGVTREPYLIFTANAFALMGLRQLYFLIGGLLDRLVFLSYGLSLILAFIGVKLVLHALHENELPFVNDGQPVAVPEVSTGVSLAFIGTVLVITTVASLLKTRRDEKQAKKANRIPEVREVS